MSWRVKIAVLKEGASLFEASFDRSPITIGARSENDVVLNDPFVSGRHATVLVSRGELVFRDHSTNGSFVDDRRIEEEDLGHQDTVSIPPFELTLEFEEDELVWKTAYRGNLAQLAAEAAPEIGGELGTEEMATPVGAERPIPPPARQKTARHPEAKDNRGAPDPPEQGLPPSSGPEAVEPTHLIPGPAPAVLKLMSVGENLSQQQVSLPRRTIRLGRSETADVRIPAPTISRLHAAITPLDDGGFLVADLDSANGTFVNGRQVKEVELLDGDEVRFGDVEFRFCLTGASRAPQALPAPPRAPVAPSEALDIQIQTVGGVEVVEIQGRVDSHHYIELSDALDRAIDNGARAVMADLSRVDFMSHAGLGVLVRCLTRLHKLGGDLWLAGPSQRILDALSLSRLDSLFRGRIAKTSQDGLRGLLGQSS